VGRISWSVLVIGDPVARLTPQDLLKSWTTVKPGAFAFLSHVEQAMHPIVP